MVVTFGDKLPGASRGAEKNYTVMTIDDICNMASSVVIDRRPPGEEPLPRQGVRMCGERYGFAEDALLFLWRVSSQVEEAYRVVRAWGFVPKSEIVWIKASRMMDAKILGGAPNPLYKNERISEEGDIVQVPKIHFGMGRYVRASHETCIIAARGKAIPLIKNRSTRSVFYATTGEHSEKPEAFYKIVEELCEGPRLELFARRHRKGWTTAGDEILDTLGECCEGAGLDLKP